MQNFPDSRDFPFICFWLFNIYLKYYVKEKYWKEMPGHLLLATGCLIYRQLWIERLEKEVNRLQKQIAELMMEMNIEQKEKIV